MIRGMKLVLTAALLLGAALQCCCSAPKPARYDLVVGVDPAVTTAIAVHVVGVKDESSEWASTSLTDYWQPSSQFRREHAGLVKEFLFAPGRMEPQTLSSADPIWDAWSASGKPAALVVLASLPGPRQDRAGPEDRRLIIPLMDDRWPSGQKIMVTVQRNSLVLNTLPKPVK